MSSFREKDIKVEINKADLVSASGQLRHAYMQLAKGRVRRQKMFADGLIAPVIRMLENATTSKIKGPAPDKQVSTRRVLFAKPMSEVELERFLRGVKRQLLKKKARE